VRRGPESVIVDIRHSNNAAAVKERCTPCPAGARAPSLRSTNSGALCCPSTCKAPSDQTTGNQTAACHGVVTLNGELIRGATLPYRRCLIGAVCCGHLTKAALRVLRLLTAAMAHRSIAPLHEARRHEDKQNLYRSVIWQERIKVGRLCGD
jgi:hypothetical protein